MLQEELEDLEPIADGGEDRDDCASDPSDLVVESDIDGVPVGDESLGEEEPKGSDGSCSEFSQESDDDRKVDDTIEPPMAPREPEPEHPSKPAETPNHPCPKLKAFWKRFVVPKTGGEKEPMSDSDRDSEIANPFRTSEPQDVKSELSDSESEPPEPVPSPEAGGESPQHQDSSDDMSWDPEEYPHVGGGEFSESEVDEDQRPVVSEDAFLNFIKNDALETFAKVG